MPKKRDARIASLLLHVFKHGSIATREAVDLCGAERRRVLTDLRELVKNGTLEARGVARHRRYVLHPRFVEGALRPEDQISLLVGRDVTRFLEGTPLYQDPVAPAAVRVRVRYHTEPSRDYALCGDIVRSCLTALMEDRRLAVVYEGAKGQQQYPLFQPLTLVVYRRALYVVGRAGRRTYALAIERMAEATPGEPVARPADWDVDAWLADRFGLAVTDEDVVEDVVLEFSASVAYLVRARTWHPSQRLETLRDGKIRLHLRVRGRELTRFVLEWGDRVKVIAPARLRDEVVRELRAALASYGEDIRSGTGT